MTALPRPAIAFGAHVSLDEATAPLPRRAQEASAPKGTPTMPTTKTWDQLTTMEKHRLLNDKPVEAAQLRDASEPGQLSAYDRSAGASAIAQLESMGTMGQHRLMNDKPAEALRLYTAASKIDPERFAGRLRNVQRALGKDA